MFWKMQAGTGEVVFAPLYLVLKQRGVKFEFFHQVKHLCLSPDKKSIEKIVIDRQVDLFQETYDPLVTIEGLPCFPSEPLYPQIENAEALRGINLESFYTPWRNVAAKHLHQGRDFDAVILGIPIASLPFICPELIAANPQWQAMVQNIKTVQTQTFQLWLKTDRAGLGWSTWMQQPPVVTSCGEPYSIGGDRSQVLPWEGWGQANFPVSAGYFCGVLLGEEPPPPTNYQFPQQSLQQAKGNALNFLNRTLPKFWTQAATPTGFNWNLLVDPKASQGKQRFEAQYLRVNINPSDRYTLSIAGSNKYRLKTHKSGFNNLYLTGDWINNGLNFGCMEAATIAGLQTARAISGYPQQIIGENFGVVS
jgi:uncharacterized protein with NAD-binding domain and iron-sulfur cluster